MKHVQKVVLLGLVGLMLFGEGHYAQSAQTQPQVLLEETFNNPLSGWKQDPLWTYTEGEYRLFLQKSGLVSWSLAPDPSLFALDDYCVEVQVRLFVGAALSKDGIVGFYVAAKQKDKKTFPEGVLVALNGAGTVLVANTSTGSDGVAHISPTLNLSGLVDDPSQFQTLRIEAKGGNLAIAVNGFELISFSSKTRGRMGFMGISFKEPNLNARFDTLRISSSCA